MQANLLVHCQYYENYDVFARVPRWKPKGGHTFKMPIDSDTVFYADEDLLIQAIKKLVASQNSNGEKFEYVEHELVTTEPTVVEGLDAEVERLYKRTLDGV